MDAGAELLGEVVMATLMFACPNTRQFIKTGIETDEYTLSCLRPIRMRVRCSYCGTEHALPMKYGFLEEPESGMAAFRASH